jgi:hypothetical protein
MREYVDQLKNGDENLLIPPSSFKWDTYKFIFTANLRQRCGATGNGHYYDEDIHNEIMEMFGDELYEIYKINKK